MGVLVPLGLLGMLIAVALLILGARRTASRVALLSIALALVGALFPRDLSFPDFGNPSSGITVAARASGGWDVVVPETAGATRYRVLVDGQPAATTPAPGAVIVDDPGWRDGSRYGPGPIRTITVEALRGREVAASASSTVCAPVLLLAARGTGENPGKSQFALGIGSRNWRTWSHLVAQLGLSPPTPGVRSTVVAAAPVRYPARAVVTNQGYSGSRDTGKDALRAMWAAVHDQCPDTLVIASGYSQGADVVASVWQEDATPVDGVAGVVLFADPHFNKDWTRQGVTRPASGRYENDGLLDARPLFAAERIDPVQAWCWPADPVCQSFPSLSWHGPAYDCYEEWAAFDLARAVEGPLRDLGYDVAAPAPPTCVPDASGR